MGLLKPLFLSLTILGPGIYGEEYPSIGPQMSLPEDTITSRNIFPDSSFAIIPDTSTDSTKPHTNTFRKQPTNSISSRIEKPRENPDTSHTPVPSDSFPPAPLKADTNTTRQSPIPELRPVRVKDQSHTIHRQKAMSRQRLTRLQIQKVPAAQGDPLKVLTALPGVTNTNDLSVKPIVRGGKMEETRVLWDGIPLLQPFHFSGMYSLFNVESIESMTLYSGAFPIQGRNALSGALFLESRPAPLDSLQLSIDLSMLRGHSYIGIPIVKNKFGIYASYQSLWYDFVFKRLWEFVDILSRSDDISNTRREFNKYIDLPNFRDLQWGAHSKITDNLKLNYNGLRSRDVFTILDRMMRYYVKGEEVSPLFYQRHKLYADPPLNTLKAGLDLDTLSIINVKNNINHLHLRWEPTPKLVIDNTFGIQTQEWNVQFLNDETWVDNAPDQYTFEGYKTYEDPSTFELKREMRSWQTQVRYDGVQNHILTGGFSYDFLSEYFNLDLIRIAFEMIYNGNSDLINTLGIYNPAGYAIVQDTSNPLLEHVDYFSQFAEQIVMKEKGNVWAGFYGFFLSDQWLINPRHKLNAGIRLEYEQRNEDIFLSPRFSYFFNLDSANEFTLAAGLYSQNDHPFYIRLQNPGSPSEKSIHANAEWTHHFTPDYRLEWQNYYKYYFDLQITRLYNTGRLDWTEERIADIPKDVFDTLPDKAKDTIISLFGEREVQHKAQGIGHAFGSEVSFFYDPVPQWSGWFSAEFAHSKRQDTTGELWYDFKFNRPWSINWVNRFRFPKGKTELAIRSKWAAGLPYTDYKTPEFDPDLEASDTLFVVKKRHGRRYGHYTRVDIRLTRHGLLAGRPFQTYMGIWNIMNRPNFLLRDSKTDRIKFFDYNFPIPIIFLGMKWEL